MYKWVLRTNQIVLWTLATVWQKIPGAIGMCVIAIYLTGLDFGWRFLVVLTLVAASVALAWVFTEAYDPWKKNAKKEEPGT